MKIIWKQPNFATFGKGKSRTRFIPGSNAIPAEAALLLVEDEGFKTARRKGFIEVIQEPEVKSEGGASGDEGDKDPWEGLNKEQALQYVENLADLKVLQSVLDTNNLPGGAAGAKAIKKAARDRVAAIKEHLKSEGGASGDEGDKD